MKKVLIISYHFPPVNNIAARRFGGMVGYMKEFGWEPFVLTTNSKGNLPVNIPEKNIIRIGENYQKGDLVSDEEYRGIPFLLKIPYFFYRKLGAEIISLDRFIFNWGRELKKNKEIIRRINPDIIIGTCYPAVDIWMAKFFSEIIKKPWIADLEDPLSLLNNSKVPFIRFLDEKIDRALIKSASAVIALGPKMVAKLGKLYGRQIEIVYNGFNGEELEPEINLKDKKNKNIYYAGRFQSQRIPAIKLLIDWFAKDKKYDFSLKIRSLGPKEANEEILRYAKEKNVCDKIDLLPATSPEVIFQEEKEADILLSLNDLEKKINNSECQIAGKLTEYLSLRVPIISINRSDSDDGLVLEDTSRGYLVSDLNGLDRAINDILQKGILNYFNWEKVKKYSKKYQTKKLCNILDKICEVKIN